MSDNQPRGKLLEMPLNRKQQRAEAQRALAARKKLIARQQKEQDRVWARLRKHVEGSVLYEVEHRTIEGFDSETRRVQALFQEFAKTHDLTLSMLVSSLANYLSRLTGVMEKLQAGELVPCPECTGSKVEGPCPLCQGTSLVLAQVGEQYRLAKAHAETEKKEVTNALRKPEADLAVQPDASPRSTSDES